VLTYALQERTSHTISSTHQDYTFHIPVLHQEYTPGDHIPPEVHIPLLEQVCAHLRSARKNVSHHQEYTDAGSVLMSPGGPASLRFACVGANRYCVGGACGLSVINLRLMRLWGTSIAFVWPALPITWRDLTSNQIVTPFFFLPVSCSRSFSIPLLPQMTTQNIRPMRWTDYTPNAVSLHTQYRQIQRFSFLKGTLISSWWP
jgi:hypothetical protein